MAEDLSKRHGFEWGYGTIGRKVTAARTVADFLGAITSLSSSVLLSRPRVIANLPRCSTWLSGTGILEALESF
jgi:hypothetical protein